MTTSQLQIYNGALRLLKQLPLATLTDDIAVRYAMDDVWASRFTDYCLEQGFWYFAMRSSQLTNDPTFTTQFGYRYRFVKPTDWVRTAGVGTDEYLNNPLVNCLDEAGSWFADIPVIYTRYVSNDLSYGLNFAIWPATFTLYAEAEMALRITPTITASDGLIKIIHDERKKRLTDARSKAAMTESAVFPPTGTWTRSRRGRSMIDRGNTSRLIG